MEYAHGHVPTKRLQEFDGWTPECDPILRLASFVGAARTRFISAGAFSTIRALMNAVSDATGDPFLRDLAIQSPAPADAQIVRFDGLRSDIATYLSTRNCPIVP